jgi:hypothetical protein
MPWSAARLQSVQSYMLCLGQFTLGLFTTVFPFYNPPSLQTDWSPPSQITNTKHRIGCELLALNGHSHDTLSNSSRKQQMQVNSFASNHPITALAENFIPTAAVS